MKKFLLFFLSMTMFVGTSLGQNALSKQKKIEALNSVLHFVNEGAHGLLIVHRMLENYNQDINKYVDLESFKINYYTNKDLPKDIFEDLDNWFYDTSPYEWYDIALAQSRETSYLNSTQIIATITKMKSILTQVNQLRFDLDDKIIDKDLTDTSALNRVYDDLQKGVDLYDEYFAHHQNVLQLIAAAYKPLTPSTADVSHPAIYKAMTDVYISTRSVLLAIRKKEDENMEALIAKQGAAIKAFENIRLETLGSSLLSSRKVKRTKSNIQEQANLSIASAKQFFETAEVPEEYKQYGKFYYYYNSEIINKFNRYGNGIVFELNNMIDYLDMPVLIYTELPHYYKYILPKKLETVEHIAATDSKIVRLPSKLKDRDIQMSTRRIKVDSLRFEVSLYDHMIEDGDIISLNFNGDWIVEKMPLTSEKKKLKLMLNEEGKNFFILHAENVGRRPPNTMAVDYFYRGRKHQIILKSDLNVSEMIEIEYVDY